MGTHVSCQASLHSERCLKKKGEAWLLGVSWFAGSSNQPSHQPRQCPEDLNATG